MTTISDNVIYRRVAPILLVLTFVLGIGAVVGTYVNDQNDRERDRAITRVNTQRIDDSARLLGCFDRFATDLAGGLPKVREASANRNDTITATFAALEDLLVAALSADVDGIPPPRAARLVKRLAAALANYRQADTELLDVQADNPYPAPPSEFCSLPDPE